MASYQWLTARVDDEGQVAYFEFRVMSEDGEMNAVRRIGLSRPEVEQLHDDLGVWLELTR